MEESARANKSKRSKKSAAARAQREAKQAEARLRRLWITAFVVLLIGLALSGELVRLHFAALADPQHHSYCSVNATVSCDAVTRSRYSVAFGVPLAMWGLFGYTLMAVTALFGYKSRLRAHAALLFTLTSFSLVVAVVLAAISHFMIHAWCLLCIGTYAVNGVAAVVAYRLLALQGARACYRDLLERFNEDRGRGIALTGLTAGLALAIMLLFPKTNTSAVLIGPQSKPSSAASDGSSAPEASAQTIAPLPPGAHVEQGETSDGLPWIGAPEPVVTLTEFFDYECSHCQEAFRGLHELLALNADRLRLVVRHFPLNPTCNRSMRSRVYEHSCTYAKLANCARKQHRFWEAHEYLFNHGGRLVEQATFVSELGLDKKALNACMSRADDALDRDIEAGIKLDLHGTPAFVFDGKAYMQMIPPEAVRQLRVPESWR